LGDAHICMYRYVMEYIVFVEKERASANVEVGLPGSTLCTRLPRL
jgi:hypothetical protein